MSVALNGGLRVILTSAVLRSTRNSRIKACVHWENANWLNCSTNNTSFFLSPPYTLRAQHQVFIPVRIKKKKKSLVSFQWCVTLQQSRGAVSVICVYPSNISATLELRFSSASQWGGVSRSGVSFPPNVKAAWHFNEAPILRALHHILIFLCLNLYDAQYIIMILLWWYSISIYRVMA